MSQTTKPARPTRGRRAAAYLRSAMVALALVLPMTSLAVLGTLWLWQNNALLVWSAAASATSLLIYALERWLVARGAERGAIETRASSEQPGLHGLTPREQQAWQAIEVIARDVDPDRITSRDALLQLGVDTVEAVAREMRPGKEAPLWNFTVPEALAVIERVSRELNRFVVDNVPLGDRLTVADLRTIYRWRSLVAVAEKAYDLWRIVRVVNPASAVAGELREKLSGRLVEGMRTELARRLARAYVREVGRAAVDLYSGRLRTIPADRPAAEVAPIDPSPVSVLLVGQAGSGRTALLSALAAEAGAEDPRLTGGSDWQSATLTKDGELVAEVSEAPALAPSPKSADAIVERALAADAVLWTVSATRPDRARDAELIARIRDAYVARGDLRAPPIIIALTHIDRLRPFAEWAPPYDLNHPANAKAATIRDAIAAVAEDLGTEPADIVPVMLAAGEPPYNVDVVWARIVDLAPEARSVQLARRLAERSSRKLSWSRLWSQSVNAGRVLGTTLLTSGRAPDDAEGGGTS